MSMKHFKRGFLFWILPVILVVGMFSDDSFSADKIRFGILPVLDTLPIIVAKDEGAFQKNGIDLEIVNFQSALERDAAIQAGEIDGYFGDILNTVLLIGSGRNLRIVTTVFHTSKTDRMFGIVAAPKSNIKTFSDLKGKKIGISRATVIEYLLDRFFMEENVPEGFAEKLDIKKIPIRMQMLLSGKIPAALLPEPLITLAETKGAIPVIDDRKLDTCLTVIALRLSDPEGQADLVKRFLAAYDSAVAGINKNPEGYKETLVTKTRFPMPVKDRFKVPGFPEKEVPSQADVAAALKWLTRNGMLKTAPAYGDIVFKLER